MTTANLHQTHSPTMPLESRIRHREIWMPDCVFGIDGDIATGISVCLTHNRPYTDCESDAHAAYQAHEQDMRRNAAATREFCRVRGIGLLEDQNDA